jgi:hypothetical protein
VRRVALLFACLATTIAVHADAPPSKSDAATLRQKIAAVVEAGATPQRQAEARRTTVTQNEVNAYLAYDAAPDLPAGVVNPSVTILGGGRLSGSAIVDLDAVRKANPSAGMLDPTSYLTGRLPITATGVLTTTNGTGRFQIESAAIGSVPVPKVVLQQIVSYYTRTPDRPGGIGLDEPFALPARISEIQVQRGQAIIVQ